MVLRLLAVGYIRLFAAAAAHAATVRADRGARRSAMSSGASMDPAHPLIGQVLKGEAPIVIAPGDCERSPLQQLIARFGRPCREGGVVLLGEVHDNPEHHLVREDILWPRWDDRRADGRAASGRGVRAHPHRPASGRGSFYEQPSPAAVCGPPPICSRSWLEGQRLAGGGDVRAALRRALWAQMPILPGDARASSSRRWGAAIEAA